MALFSWGKRKEDIPAPSPEIEPEEAPAPVDPAWARLQTAIAEYPQFRLVTFDGMYWIDPFTGELISAPFDLEDTIQAYFAERDHWRTGRTRSALQLYAQRWLLWLEEDNGRDPRFRLFTNAGHWFNPCTRAVSDALTEDMQSRAAHFLRRMAHELAQTPDASPHNLPSLEELEVAMGRREPPAPAVEEEPGHHSGIRTTQSSLMGSGSSSARPAVAHDPAATPVAVPPGHVAYVVPSGGGTAGGAAEGAAMPLPALAQQHSGAAAEMVAAAMRDLQSTYQLSETALERRLAEHSPGHQIPDTSDALLQALADLREVMAQSVAERSGPSNQELYNCLISMREDHDTGALRRLQGGDADSAVPVVSQAQLSQEAIDQLVSSLRSISLVADRITTGSHRSSAPGEALEPLSDGSLADDDLADDEDLPPSLDADELGAGPDAEWAEDMEKASAVQGHLLGGIPPLQGVDLAIEYRPYTSIGGDFYQVVQLDDQRFFFMVGDVSGHGVQAALIVSSIVNSLKIILRRAAECSLADIICELNDYMRECLPTGKFFTAFSGIIDTSGSQPILECVCSGHHPTICLNASQAEPIREIGKHGMGIGIVRSETFRKQMHSETYTLSHGDVLAIYTDGITETMDENGEELGEMLVRCSFFAHLNLEPHLQIQAVLSDIAEESDGVVNDDLTVMVIRIH